MPLIKRPGRWRKAIGNSLQTFGQRMLTESQKTKKKPKPKTKRTPEKKFQPVSPTNEQIASAGQAFQEMQTLHEQALIENNRFIERKTKLIARTEKRMQKPKHTGMEKIHAQIEKALQLEPLDKRVQAKLAKNQILGISETVVRDDYKIEIVKKAFFVSNKKTETLLRNAQIYQELRQKILARLKEKTVPFIVSLRGKNISSADFIQILTQSFYDHQAIKMKPLKPQQQLRLAQIEGLGMRSTIETEYAGRHHERPVHAVKTTAWLIEEKNTKELMQLCKTNAKEKIAIIESLTGRIKAHQLIAMPFVAVFDRKTISAQEFIQILEKE